MIFFIWNDKDERIGSYETTCWAYAERYAKENFTDYSYLTRSL